MLNNQCKSTTGNAKERKKKILVESLEIKQNDETILHRAHL